MTDPRIDDATCHDYGVHKPGTRHAASQCSVYGEPEGAGATRCEYAQIAHETYMDTLDRVVSTLGDVAERLKREATPVDPIEGRSLSSDRYPHSYAASRAIHELHWGIANAHLDTLIKSAAEADAAARDARQGRES